jgi:hypothetical protein
MIRGEARYIRGSRAQQRLETVIAEMPALSRRAADEVAQVLREGNRIDRLRGIDADGRPLVPVGERFGAYAGAGGPPLAPWFDASGSIQSFFADVAPSRNGWTITAGFRGPIAQILRWHAEGKSGVGHPITRGGVIVGFRGIPGRVSGIYRDIFGVSDRTLSSVREVADRHRSRVRDALRGIPVLGAGRSW